jgi:hypothetical protein
MPELKNPNLKQSKRQELPFRGDANAVGKGDGDEDEGFGDKCVLEHRPGEGQVHPANDQSIKKQKFVKLNYIQL